MNKEEMQRAIIIADARGQKKKHYRMISLIALFSICVFILCHKSGELPLWQEIPLSIFAGYLAFYLFVVALSLFGMFSGIELIMPEDRELKYLLKIYKEKFGEEFRGPWSK